MCTMSGFADANNVSLTSIKNCPLVSYGKEKSVFCVQSLTMKIGGDEDLFS